MNIRIDNFHGIQPRVHPSLLVDGMATVAHNCRLKSGKLVPLREPALVEGAGMYLEGGLTDIKDAQSIHVWRRYGGGFDFLLFGGVTWMAEGNLADDQRMRVVVSGDTGVTFTDAGSTAHENVPAIWMRTPSNGSRLSPVPLAKDALPAPHVSRSSSEELSANKRYTQFFWTWVDEYGYESPASPPSKIESSTDTWTEDVIEYDDGDEITISLVSGASWPTGAKMIRIYKVAAGTGEASDGIQFVAEEVLPTNNPPTGFMVKILDDMLGEAMPEIEAPPHDLRCILEVPGGYYVGISPSHPHTVYFSDIGLIYSWPVAYRYDVADNVVALAVTSNTVFALTDGWPYVLSGTAPESMSVAKLAGPAACVSERGVCVYRNSAYYVSNAGLMVIANDASAGTVCANLTDKAFTKEQWQALNPASCMMGQFDGALHLFFRTADGKAADGLVIDLTEGADAITTHEEAARCVCTDNTADRLYYVREERG